MSERPGLLMRHISYLVWLLTVCVGLPLTVGAEGFGPFPVRNFQALDQLVLAMPGDRAAVLKKGISTSGLKSPIPRRLPATKKNKPT